MDIWSAVLQGLITSGLLAIIIVATKDLIRNWINKPFEKELREFSSDLDKVREQVNFKFTIYHQKKFEALSKTYSLLNSAILHITTIYSFPYISSKNVKDALDQATSHTNEAKETLYGSSIFIDEKLFDELSSILLDLNPIMHDIYQYCLVIDNDKDQMVIKSKTLIFKKPTDAVRIKLNKLVPKIRKALEHDAVKLTTEQN